MSIAGCDINVVHPDPILGYNFQIWAVGQQIFVDQISSDDYAIGTGQRVNQAARVVMNTAVIERTVRKTFPKTGTKKIVLRKRQSSNDNPYVPGTIQSKIALKLLDIDHPKGSKDFESVAAILPE